MTPRPLALAFAFALAFAVAFAVVPAAAFAQEATVAAPSKAQQLEKMYAEFWEEALKLSPLRATSVGDPRYNDLLPNVFSEAYREKEKEFVRRWLARAEAIGSDGLDGQARLSY